MNFLIAATFKSNKTSAEVESWLKEVAPVAKKSKAEIIVAPSFLHLSAAHTRISHLESSIYLASQDVSPFPAGSYTGAVNATQLKDLGISYCIVGHSERRRYFHETHTEIANKVGELVAVGITPILCLAEDDIFPQLAALPESLKFKIIYCYEPPSDIGGTETATIGDIARVVKLIKTSVVQERVMYGGSVNGENIAKLLTLDIDGVLVSSASLDPAKFSTLLHAYGKSKEK